MTGPAIVALYQNHFPQSTTSPRTPSHSQKSHFNTKTRRILCLPLKDGNISHNHHNHHNHQNDRSQWQKDGLVCPRPPLHPRPHLLLIANILSSVPCIRGHRSTKCNHAGDRILMEVRKPGRPLSNCPCRPGQPCACGAVKVAIPKKKKCGTCPPDGQKPPASASREHSPIQSTLSRTVNADSYRVTKTGTPASRHGQKAAFDPSKFLRANPSILSMASPGGMMAPMVQNGIAVSQPLNLPGYGAPVTVPNMPVSTQFDMGYRPHFPLNMPMPAAYPANGHVPLHIKMENGSPPPYPGDSFLGLASPMLPSAYPDDPNLGVGSPMLPSPYTDDSNLGVGSPVFPPPQQYSLASRHSRSSSGSAPDYLAGLGTPSMPHSPPITGPAKGSCCGGVTEPNNAIPAHLPQYTKPAIPHYEPQGVTQHHNTPVTMGMSNGFTYPAQYGSWNMPLNPQMWQQLASGYQPSMPAPPMQAAPNNITPDLGISQHCTCGPDCQCLGCVVHPFNDQTYRYVNSALGVSSINGHSNHSSPVTNGINAYSNPSSPGTNGVNGVSGVNGHSQINGDAVNGSPASPAPKPGSCCAPAATTVQTPTISPESPKQVPESSPEARTTSSDEASDLGEVQHTVSEIEFLWLDMPQEPCYGVSITCPCGDACSCVGCTLHNP